MNEPPQCIFRAKLIELFKHKLCGTDETKHATTYHSHEHPECHHRISEVHSIVVCGEVLDLQLVRLVMARPANELAPRLYRTCRLHTLSVSVY